MTAIFSPRSTFLLIASVAIVFGAGCRTWFSGDTSLTSLYQTQAPSTSSVNSKAHRLNEHGVEAFEDGSLEKAEERFREALVEDVSYGPAHNNLGQIYLTRHQLYLATWEFEYAANLMPSSAEPVIGQGLAYELAERPAEAENYFRQAILRKSDHPDAIAGLARVLVKQDSDPLEIATLLDEILLRDSRPAWVAWAKELRQSRYRDSAFETLAPDKLQSSDDLPKQKPESTNQPATAAFPSDSEPIEWVPPGESQLVDPTAIEDLPPPTSLRSANPLPPVSSFTHPDAHSEN